MHMFTNQVGTCSAVQCSGPQPLVNSSRTHTSHPNSLKWVMSSFFPVHASYGVLPFRARVGDWFLMYTACDTASSHRYAGSPFVISITHTSLIRVQLKCSAMPFWEGEYGAEVSMVIPSSAQNFFTSSFTNSFLLSTRKNVRAFPKHCLILLACSLMRCVALPFMCKNSTVPYQALSLLKEI